MELMVEYGMKPQEVLTAATAGNAKLFDLDRYGRVEVGNRADLIGVRGNPLKAIQAMREVRLVMKAGEIILREE